MEILRSLDLKRKKKSFAVFPQSTSQMLSLAVWRHEKHLESVAMEAEQNPANERQGSKQSCSVLTDKSAIL